MSEKMVKMPEKGAQEFIQFIQASPASKNPLSKV
jgi:hypothetical protein